jgi:TorA maturation chaperone TorD
MITEAACAAARGQFYGYLAGAYLRPPTAQSVSPFLDDVVLRQLAEQFGADAVAELEQFRSRFDGSWDTLDQEYQSLFTVPLGRYVTPYEAVYRDERVVDGEVVHGLLMGPSTLAVKAIYRDAGVEMADTGGAVARAQALQRRLLQEHLRQWAPRLCERIRANAPGPFYRGIVALTEAFLDQEAGAQDASCE